MRRATLAVGLTSAVLLMAGPAAAQEDAYLEGYAAALLEHRFGLLDANLDVRDGVLRLDPRVLPEARREAISGALSGIAGLEVEVLAPADVVAAPEPAPPAAVVEPERRDEPPVPPEHEVTLVSGGQGWLPPEALFGDLIADPRWPRFSASLQSYHRDPELDTVFSANFGATLPVYGWTAWGGQWQIGAQAGVFSIFDLESDSFDLINADYLVGAPLQVRYGDFSGQLRVYHDSSHLGDEYVLRERVDRVNLSYEVLDALLSYELFDVLRVYGGGGAIVRSEPDLDPWLAQAGLELISPDPLIGNLLYPVAAFDFQTAEELDWDQNYSVRAGLEVRTEVLEERRLQFLLEYFNGRSPHGQFYDRSLEYFGAGLHFFF